MPRCNDRNRRKGTIGAAINATLKWGIASLSMPGTGEWGPPAHATSSRVIKNETIDQSARDLKLFSSFLKLLRFGVFFVFFFFHHRSVTYS